MGDRDAVALFEVLDLTTWAIVMSCHRLAFLDVTLWLLQCLKAGNLLDRK